MLILYYLSIGLFNNGDTSRDPFLDHITFYHTDAWEDLRGRKKFLLLSIVKRKQVDNFYLYVNTPQLAAAGSFIFIRTIFFLNQLFLI